MHSFGLRDLGEQGLIGVHGPGEVVLQVFDLDASFCLDAWMVLGRVATGENTEGHRSTCPLIDWMRTCRRYGCPQIAARRVVKPYTLVTAGQATSDVRRRLPHSGIKMPRDR